jgi:DNA-binding response OmpR family regulator
MKSDGHILIVDDEAALRQTLARILQRAGFEVTTSPNGTEALKLLSQHAFDLVYLDIRMPDINGLEILKTIHTKHPEVPVVLFTAQPDLNSAVQALRHGATDYLLKPLKPQTLLDRTQSILARTKKERRKREIQRQIEALQLELTALEQENALPEGETLPSTASDERYLRRGNLTLDLHTHRVTINDRSITLPPTSFDYLLVLARHTPDVVDYQTLVSEAQGYETDPHEAQELTKWHIHNIRQALEPDTRNPIYVINVRGIGYRLVTA